MDTQLIGVITLLLIGLALIFEQLNKILNTQSKNNFRAGAYYKNENGKWVEYTFNKQRNL